MTKRSTMTKDEAIRMLLRAVDAERALLVRAIDRLNRLGESDERDGEYASATARLNALQDVQFAVEQGLGLSAAEDWR